MEEDGFKPGRIQRLEDCFEGRLEHFYAHDQDAVWRMLTEPKSLAQWLAGGTIELRIGGAVRIDFEDSGRKIDSTVLALEPRRLLEYSWSNGDEPKRPMRWELTPVKDGTRITLTVSVPLDEDVAKACAGFEGHLEMLATALEGVPVKFPLDLYLKARSAYQAMVPK